MRHVGRRPRWNGRKVGFCDLVDLQLCASTAGNIYIYIFFTFHLSPLLLFLFPNFVYFLRFWSDYCVWKVQFGDVGFEKVLSFFDGFSGFLPLISLIWDFEVLKLTF